MQLGVDPWSNLERARWCVLPFTLSVSLYGNRLLFVSLLFQMASFWRSGIKSIAFSTSLGLDKCSVISDEQMLEPLCSPVL